MSPSSSTRPRRSTTGTRSTIVTLKGDDPDAVDIQRHTASHVMAQAIVRLFPGAKYAIGPTIESGFYYDFQLPESVAEADLARIEKEMARIVSQNQPVERFELPVDEALAVFGAGEPGTSDAGLPTGLDQPYKVDLIEDLVTAAEATGDEVPTISVYRQGEFVDLCRGPHLPSTDKLGAAPSSSPASPAPTGAATRRTRCSPASTAPPSRARRSWRRTSRRSSWPASATTGASAGTSTSSASTRRAPASRSSTPRACASGTPWSTSGAPSTSRAGYEEISTPVILRRELWERSGHWDNYKENMYFTTIDEQPYAVKPMNCPGGLLIYKSRRRSLP